MSRVPSTREHLAERFDRHRLVIWRDSDGSYSDDFDAQTPPGVTALRIANDEFAIKYRVLREAPSVNFLLYRPGIAANTDRKLSARPKAGGHNPERLPSRVDLGRPWTGYRYLDQFRETLLSTINDNKRIAL